jgi:hypothetical protein
MGKYVQKEEFKKLSMVGNKYIFKVRVNIHGRRHTEYYSIKKDELQKVKELNLMEFDKEYKDYLDWKPLDGGKGLHGGIFKVNRYTFDEKYVYAHTRKKTFSLPKYLFDRLENKEYILFGLRENKNSLE